MRCVLIANIYTPASMQENANEIEGMRVEIKVWNKPSIILLPAYLCFLGKGRNIYDGHSFPDTFINPGPSIKRNSLLHVSSSAHGEDYMHC
eukprot:c3389_g1_i1 orf=60-332(+)